jgi:D-lactate dehydrogenase (cytochrome)
VSRSPAHRIQSRQPPPGATPHIESAPDVTQAFISDAAHVPGGQVDGVAFPHDGDAVAALVAQASRVLAVGAQSSLTGGATPRGDLVISTRALTSIGTPGDGRIRVGAGVPLKTLQSTLAGLGLYYPPAPTFDGAFIGGTASTNAAGAATFKYGSTRKWIEGLTLVLADGSILELQRGTVFASEQRHFEIARPSGETAHVPIPTYTMPAVAKLSAGYFAAPGMDLIDLFIGSEGTLGVIVDLEVRVIPRPRSCSVLIECAGDAQAVAVTTRLRDEARAAWRQEGPLDVAAIEYMDGRSLQVVPDAAFPRAGVTRPAPEGVLLLVQIEVPRDEDAALSRLQEVLNASGVSADPIVAFPDDLAGAARLFELRETVPASVNAVIGAANERTPGIQKTAGDMVVPYERLADSLRLYRSAFERRGLRYAIWGHVSDGNLHPNVVATSLRDVELGHEAIQEIAGGVMAMGGAPLAEHGVGRSPLKQELLHDLYGDRGIEEMRAVKRALDPTWKLAPGVLFQPDAGHPV